MKKILGGTIVTTLLFASSAFSGHSHWGYTGHIGPEHWGDLNPKFKMCKEGKISHLLIFEDLLKQTLSQLPSLTSVIRLRSSTMAIVSR